MTNQERRVLELLRAIATKDAAAMQVINPKKYLQHNLSVPDGFDGFKSLVNSLPDGAAAINVVRIFEDNDYVVAHSEVDIFGRRAVFDIFRFEDGLIVEHWDNAQTLAGPNPSGHTMIDGPTDPIDLDKTEANKAIARDFVTEILMKGMLDNADKFVNSTNYTQHHPLIGDGFDSVRKAFAAWSKTNTVVEYRRIHHVLGKGNFVLVTSEGAFNGVATAFYDLFRIESGKIVEHWDTVEKIPPRNEWKNGNGKF